MVETVMAAMKDLPEGGLRVLSYESGRMSLELAATEEASREPHRGAADAVGYECRTRRGPETPGRRDGRAHRAGVMNATLRTLWQSRAPRERVVIAVLAVLVGVASYVWLVQSADLAHTRLRASVPALRAQAARLDQQAAELERLRSAAAPVGIDNGFAHAGAGTGRRSRSVGRTWRKSMPRTTIKWWWCSAPWRSRTGSIGSPASHRNRCASTPVALKRCPRRAWSA